MTGIEHVFVSGPTGQPVEAAFVRRGERAVIELAEAHTRPAPPTAGRTRCGPGAAALTDSS